MIRQTIFGLSLSVDSIHRMMCESSMRFTHHLCQEDMTLQDCQEVQWKLQDQQEIVCRFCDVESVDKIESNLFKVTTAALPHERSFGIPLPNSTSEKRRYTFY
jgi:hypothetical protein